MPSIRTTLFWWGFLSGAVFVLALVSGLVFLTNAREEFQSFICSQNLKHGGLLFTEYQQRHPGRYPQRLQELDLQKLEGTAHPLRCPKAKELGANAFLYLPPGEGTTADTPILICWRHPKLWVLTRDLQVKGWER